MKQEALFESIPAALELAIRDANPWWRGESPFGLPALQRWPFETVRRDLTGGLAPAVVVRGPRQVGKTVLMKQVIASLLNEGVDPRRILHLQFDELRGFAKIDMPILDLPRWYAGAILGKTLNQAAHDGEQAFVFLDEVQNLPNWAPQLKQLVDINPVRAMVTGSSALRIEAGRDSLAGRITTLEMGPLLLQEVGLLRGLGSPGSYLTANGLAPLRAKEFWLGLREFGEKHAEYRHTAFQAFSERGAYPMAQANPDTAWEVIADQLLETVVRRAIQHDLRMGPRGQRRDEHLLEEVFRLTCRYVGQSPRQALYLAELRSAMGANIGWQRVLAYLKFLDGTLLLRLIEPLELRLKKRRGASKLCLCDHTLRAAWLQEVVPLSPEGLDQQPHLGELAGHIAESAAGYFLSSIKNLDVAHFPERGSEPEVDFILTVGEQRIPVEVKYRRRIDYKDTLGLRAFIERAHYNAPFGVLVTLLDEAASDDPRIVSLPLSSLLLMR
jgi:predicted AAA+ superfamily ATPase